MVDDLRELVVRARRRDAEAFAALIERYERAALATAYAQLRDASRAGDAVQEAFLRAWAELPSLKEDGRFGGWLMQIVRNAAIDSRRRLRLTVAEFPEVTAEDADPAERAEATERAERVKEVLETLDETTRAAVMLRYYDGRSTKEIAELLEMSPAAVDMRLSRGRGVLRERLADWMEPRTGRARAIGDES